MCVVLPSQVGKTGAWLLMIRLLQDHLRSSQGVAVENSPLLPSIFLPSSLQKNTSLESNSACSSLADGEGGGEGRGDFMPAAVASTSKHSRVVPLDFLRDLLKTTSDEKTKSNIQTLPSVIPRATSATPTQSSAQLSSMPVGGAGVVEPRHVVSVSVSPYMSYNFTHSCTECSKYVRGNVLSLPEYLTFFLPSRHNIGKSINLRWCVPASQQKHCIISGNRRVLERLRLPVSKLKGDKVPSFPMTPVFMPTTGRDSLGLFNLFHNQFYQLHVLVTSESEFGKYCKAWPNHLIMALPDKEAAGLGKHLHLLIHPTLSSSPSPSLPV